MIGCVLLLMLAGFVVGNGAGQCLQEKCYNFRKFEHCQFSGDSVGGAQHRVLFGHCSGLVALRFRFSADGISDALAPLRPVANLMIESSPLVKMVKWAILNATDDGVEVVVSDTTKVDTHTIVESNLSSQLARVGGLIFGFHQLQQQCSVCVPLFAAIKSGNQSFQSLRVHLAISSAVEGSVHHMLRQRRFIMKDVMWLILAYISDGLHLAQGNAVHPDAHWGNLLCNRLTSGDWQVVWADPGASRVNVTLDSDHWHHMSKESLLEALAVGMELGVRGAPGLELLLGWNRSLTTLLEQRAEPWTPVSWYTELHGHFETAWNDVGVKLPRKLRNDVTVRLNPIYARLEEKTFTELAEQKTEIDKLKMELETQRSTLEAQKTKLEANIEAQKAELEAQTTNLEANIEAQKAELEAQKTKLEAGLAKMARAMRASGLEL